MDRRTKAAYQAVFRFISENVLTLVGVASFTSDFEKAMRNALKSISPATKRYTCHFHYCQALKRRAWQTPGITNVIRLHPKCRYMHIFVVPFTGFILFVCFYLGPFTTASNVCHCCQLITFLKLFAICEKKQCQQIKTHSTCILNICTDSGLFRCVWLLFFYCLHHIICELHHMCNI